MNAPTSANPAGCDVELPVAGIIPFSATDWPGKLTSTIFTQGCMWACTYCHNPTLQPITPGEHTFAAVVDLLGQRHGLIDALVISGGEPTLHSGLGDAIAATHRIGFPVGLHTCGYAPGRLEVLLESEETRPDWVGLDIKALPSDMPAVTGCSLRAATGSWQSLRLLADARDRLGLDLQVRTTIWPDSILERHLDDVRTAVADYGCELVVQYARGVNERGEYYANLF